MPRKYDGAIPRWQSPGVSRSRRMPKPRKIGTVNNVLITGGAGFIGSSLTRDLAARGHRITILDNLSAQIHGSGSGMGPPAAHAFVRGDVRSREDCRRALAGQEVLVHLAAETGTGQSMYDIERYVDVNVRGTAQLLDLLANEPHSVERIVVASSRAIYGEGKYDCGVHGTVYPGARRRADLERGDFEVKCPRCGRSARAVPTDEDSLPSPASIYGISKLAQEQLCMTVGRSLGIPTVVLRYQNVYGPGQSLRNPYTGILSIFSTRIRNGSAISIFEDGHESRDFVYIDDAVQATRLAVEADVQGVEVFNVGSGARTEVLSVAHALRAALGGTSPVVIDGSFRAGDIRESVADLARIRARLGYEPQVAFTTGIARFVEWVLAREVPQDRFDSTMDEMRRRGLYR